MTKSTWSAILLAGLLLTAIGFGMADAGTYDGAATRTSTATVLTLMLTAGLAACLAGTLGLMGMIGWMPGVAAAAPEVQLENID